MDKWIDKKPKQENKTAKGIDLQVEIQPNLSSDLMGREFELCEAGRLLIISANLPEELSRKTCLAMNELAEGFAGMEEIG